MLADTKAKATEVNEKLIAADETRVDQREARAVPAGRDARLGAVLRHRRDVASSTSCTRRASTSSRASSRKSMDKAEKAGARVEAREQHHRHDDVHVYRYINRGLYERDKLSFKLIVTLKILRHGRAARPGRRDALPQGRRRARHQLGARQAVRVDHRRGVAQHGAAEQGEPDHEAAARRAHPQRGRVARVVHRERARDGADPRTSRRASRPTRAASARSTACCWCARCARTARSCA